MPRRAAPAMGFGVVSQLALDARLVEKIHQIGFDQPQHHDAFEHQHQPARRKFG